MYKLFKKQISFVLSFIFFISNIGNVSISANNNLNGLLPSFSGNLPDENVATSTNIVKRNFAYSQGDGTEDNPFLIYTTEDLKYYFKSNEDTTGKFYKLMADIDASSSSFFPLCDSTKAFNGSFDGNGNKISNVSIYSPKSLYPLGLFARAGKGCEIKNLTLENFNITGKDKVGSLIGSMNTINSSLDAIKLKNITIDKSSISGYNYLGGIIGDGTFADISETTVTNSKIIGNAYIGGFIGRTGASHISYSSVVDGYISSSTATITAQAGGLVGRGFSPIFCSYVTGTIVNGRAFNGYNSGSERYEQSYFSGNLINNRNPIKNTETDNALFLGNVNANNCYFNYEEANLSSNYLYGKSTEELKSRSTYENWENFDENWKIVEGQSYPTLKIKDNEEVEIIEDEIPLGNLPSAFVIGADFLSAADFFGSFIEINTTKVASNTHNELKILGYNSVLNLEPKWEDVSNENNDINHPLNSDILVFYGHGSPASIVWYYKDADGTSHSAGLTKDSLKNSKAKFAFFFSCETDLESDENSISITRYAHENLGMETTIGFSKEIDTRDQSLPRFINYFFTGLSAGYSIGDSLDLAKAQNDYGNIINRKDHGLYSANLYGNRNAILDLRTFTVPTNNQTRSFSTYNSEFAELKELMNNSISLSLYFNVKEPNYNDLSLFFENKLGVDFDNLEISLYDNDNNNGYLVLTNPLDNKIYKMSIENNKINRIFILN